MSSYDSTFQWKFPGSTFIPDSLSAPDFFPAYEHERDLDMFQFIGEPEYRVPTTELIEVETKKRKKRSEVEDLKQTRDAVRFKSGGGGEEEEEEFDDGSQDAQRQEF